MIIGITMIFTFVVLISTANDIHVYASVLKHLIMHLHEYDFGAIWVVE